MLQRGQHWELWWLDDSDLRAEVVAKVAFVGSLQMTSEPVSAHSAVSEQKKIIFKKPH